jgi:hypothetical protein
MPNFPRVPSLEAFGRRPRCKRLRHDGPSSETLHIRHRSAPMGMSGSASSGSAPKGENGVMGRLRTWQPTEPDVVRIKLNLRVLARLSLKFLLLPKRFRCRHPVSPCTRYDHPDQHGCNKQQDFGFQCYKISEGRAGTDASKAPPHAKQGGAPDKRQVNLSLSWQVEFVAEHRRATSKNQPVAQCRDGKTSSHHKYQGRVPTAGDIQEIENPRRVDHVGERESGTEYDPSQERENQGHVEHLDHVTDNENGRRSSGNESHYGDD